MGGGGGGGLGVEENCANVTYELRLSMLSQVRVGGGDVSVQLCDESLPAQMQIMDSFRSVFIYGVVP